MVYIKNNSIDYDGNMYLTVDSLIEINNVITSLNNIALRKVNVKPYGFDKMYMDKDLIEHKLYQKYVLIKGEENYTYKVLFNTVKRNTSTV